MTKFLFWNLNKRPLKASIIRLATLYEVDIFMFVECSITPSELLQALNRNGTATYHYSPSIGCTKVEIFTRFSDDFIQPVLETDRLTVRHLKLPGLIDILIAVVHFPSKMTYRSDESQALECVNLIKSIEEAEKTIKHYRTVLVGDLNMNPFEDGVVGANALHGVMSRQIANKNARIVQNRRYPFFYNPMWSLFGDGSPGPPGTYFYSKAEPKVFFWNIFDQVLIRPDLLGAFRNDDLKILDSDGSQSFLSKTGLPDKKITSDHLPIFFKLNL